MITHTVITSVAGKLFIFGGMKTHCFAPQVDYDGLHHPWYYHLALAWHAVAHRSISHPMKILITRLLSQIGPELSLALLLKGAVVQARS